MSALLVTYDLHKPGQDYSEFYKIIKGYPWAKLSESSYAIQTSESPATIYGRLSHYMDKNDQVYVIKLSQPYSGFGPDEINKWLNQNL
jgi:hypothetical protein